VSNVKELGFRGHLILELMLLMSTIFLKLIPSILRRGLRLEAWGEALEVAHGPLANSAYQVCGSHRKEHPSFLCIGN
jgi:hypothetical protein